MENGKIPAGRPLGDDTVKKLILASTSPSRKELLAGAGYEFSVLAPGTVESDFDRPGLEPRRYAELLARDKAMGIANRFPASTVIGADTIVDFRGAVVGKPADEKEAAGILTRLFAEPHRVVTAVSVIRRRDGFELLESESSLVYPRAVTPRMIADYLASGQWREKAGAYAIRPSGDEFVERIDGSITNVIGLPMELLEKMLEKAGWHPA